MLCSVILTMVCVLNFEIVFANDTYKAAAVEYERIWDSNKTDLENMLFNIKQYETFIKLAAEKQADIVVFPENGLWTTSTEEFLYIPDPQEHVTPRNNKTLHLALQKLSSAASDNKIYVVVNILEKFNSSDLAILKYNTDIAFNRDGTLIAKYRKFNLFEEPYVNKPDKPGYSYFDTDFGVRFGLITCFDILFAQPTLELIYKYNVTDMAFPTAWFSELPFLTAIQVQEGWSFGTRTNLVAAGLNNPQIGHTGSGLYDATLGAMSGEMLHKKMSHLFVSQLTKRNRTLTFKQRFINYPLENPELADKKRNKRVIKSEGLLMKTEDLTLYKTDAMMPEYNNGKTVAINEEKKLRSKTFTYHKTLCQRSFCCQFMINFTMAFGPKELSPDISGRNGDDYKFFRVVLQSDSD